MEAPAHYNNDNGSLYKVATERGWNAYLFDIVKRLERSEKKGEFLTDLEKSKLVIDLWIKESDQEEKVEKKVDISIIEKYKLTELEVVKIVREWYIC